MKNQSATIEVGDILMYSAQIACEMLNITTVTLRKYISDGKIEAKKIGGTLYIAETNLKKFLMEK